VTHRRFTGPLAAGLLILLACAAPAPAANVTFRVEGASSTLVPETPLQTPAAAFAKDGTNSCPGGTVYGALETATAGQWSGTYFGSFSDYSVTTIKGETYDFSTPDFWAFTVNNKEIFTGPCNTVAQNGDEILYFVSRCEVGPPPDFACQNPPVRPLGLLDVPQAANKGESFGVRVVTYDGNGVATPASGATVAGDGVSATTGADGRATLAAPSAGVLTLKATKAGAVRTAGKPVCVHDGNDGTCGTTLPGGGTNPEGPQLITKPVYRAPDPELLGITRRQRFDAGKGPRELKGHVNLGSEGLLAVKLRLTRKVGKRCEYFSGSVEAFRATKECGQGYFFRVGDRADWSYLLPEPLTRGRYLLEVAVTDRKHQRRVESLVFIVR
jgi:hypothetical protein